MGLELPDFSDSDISSNFGTEFGEVKICQSHY